MGATDKAIKNAKAEAKPYKLFDGGGLYLEVMPAGSKLWRLKMRRPHLVPLSRQTLNLLKEQRQDVNEKCPWVFPGNSGWRKPMSNGTVLVALKRMGFSGKMIAHGFLALARSTIREELDYEPDVIEAQLAHKAAGPLGEAYNRAQHLTKRKRMMQDWADYIDTLASGGKVIRGKFGTG